MHLNVPVKQFSIWNQLQQPQKAPSGESLFIYNLIHLSEDLLTEFLLLACVL